MAIAPEYVCGGGCIGADDDYFKCGQGISDRPPTIWLGVLEKAGNKPPVLIARTDTVEMPTDRSNTNIDSPAQVSKCNVGDDTCSSSADVPQSWKRFDLAPYRLQDGKYAFGIRAGWSEGYAGGYGEFEALYLFWIEGDTLHPVFAQPMAFSKMIAGDWNPDGTRQHDVSDDEDVLRVLPQQSNGFHDLQLRQQTGKWRRVFKWSPVHQMYE